MSTEVRSIVPEGIPQPYSRWINERNGCVAELIAQARSYLQVSQPLDVLARPELVNQGGYDKDFYGVRVQDLADVNKTVLHRSYSEMERPHVTWYNALAECAEVMGLVLPGVSLYPKEREAASAAEEMLSCSPFRSLRVKDAGGSDMAGQFSFNAVDQLIDHLHKTYSRCPWYIPEAGLVIEPDLQNPVTYSVGQIELGRNFFSFLARQKEIHYIDANGNTSNKFGGVDLQVFRGQMAKVSKSNMLNPHQSQLMNMGAQFLAAQKDFLGIEATRISYDILEGKANCRDSEGQAGKIFLRGITDITARVGGTDPGALLAILNMLQTGNDSAQASVRLFYKGNVHSPRQGLYTDYQALKDQIGEEEQKIFVDDPDNLVLTAWVND